MLEIPDYSESDVGMMKRIESPKKRGIAYLALFLGLVAFVFVGLFILFAPRWSQMAYWPYQYPKTELYLFDYLLPIIFGVIGIIATVMGRFAYLTYKGTPVSRRFRALTALAVLGALGTGLGTTLYGASALEFYYYDAGPYLTWGNDGTTYQDPTTGITVCWHSAYLTPSGVRYGRSPTQLDQVVSVSHLSKFHQVALEGLTPDTTYYYQVPGFPLKQFHTAPVSPHVYTFCLWSDPRTNDGWSTAQKAINLPEIMAAQLAEQGITKAFSICAGDITSRGVDYETWKLWLDDISSSDFASNASHAVAVGNHARHDDEGMINLPNYYPYHNLSYSFDWGQVHFTILDRWEYTPGGSPSWWGGDGATHAAWLREDLLAHASAKFKVLVMHPNPLKNDGHHGNNTLIMNVAREYGVDVIFCGHSHSYEVKDFTGAKLNATGEITQVSNITMQIGTGGNSASTRGDYESYCQVDVGLTVLTLRPRYANGTWMSAWQLVK